MFEDAKVVASTSILFWLKACIIHASGVGRDWLDYKSVMNSKYSRMLILTRNKRAIEPFLDMSKDQLRKKKYCVS